MRSSAGGTDAERCLPRLAPGWERAAPSLNPVEGFLLSRIDGTTPWAVLREIGGLLPEEADLALESWVQAGLVVLEEAEARSSSSAAPDPAPQKALEPAAVVDPSLDLDEALQRSILAFDARLETATYHEILGVERGTDSRQIKRAYFQLSKQFHPDRYFRRNVGDHAVRLDRIFKHVALAYELLSDPETRAEIERSMASAPPPRPAAQAPTAPGEAPKGYRKPTRMENLERLRGLFRLPEKVLTERRFKARQLFQSAQAAVHYKNYIEAAASVRLAIAFDPWNAEYKQAFAGIQAEVHAARAQELLDQLDDAAMGADALKLLEEAVSYRPTDAGLHARVATLAVDQRQFETAREYAENACELEPETIEHHLLLCRALRNLGDRSAAEEALAVAKKLAPKDARITAEQKLLSAKR